MSKVFSLYPFKDSPASRKKARRAWDTICGATGLLIVCSILICFRAPYEIGEPTMYGFPLWFLVFLSYPVLLLLSVPNMILSLDGSLLVKYVVHGNQAVGLGVIDLLTLLAVWAIVRFGMLRFFGSHWVQVCSKFMLLIAGWGCVQLFYFLMVFLWSNGGFEPLHHHLADPTPEAVRVIAAEEAPSSNLELQYRKYEAKKQNR